MKGIGIIAVLLAVATSVWTWRTPEYEKQFVQEGDEGKLLTLNHEEIDPDRIASLKVVTWDSKEQKPDLFEVTKKGGDWIIPSHFDYPADAKDRVGKTAGSFMNVPRGPLVTSDSREHAALGLLDPLGSADGKAKTKAKDDDKKETRGKRIILKDQGGSTLVDIIIGQMAPDTQAYYVRETSDDRVYTAMVKPDIRTAFKDWVETDLLKVEEDNIRFIRVMDYEVDETRGAVDKHSEISFTKSPQSEEWSSMELPEGQEINQDNVKKIVTEMTTLSLIGVRPYSNRWLQRRGFYVARGGTLFGNKGEVYMITSKGLVYNMFFGEIALGDEEDTKADVKIDTPEEPQSTHNRYMALFVQYDPEFNETLAAHQQEIDGMTIPSLVGGSPQSHVINSVWQAEKTALREIPNLAGKSRADKEQKRFGKFFYVISDSSFKKLRPTQEEMFKTGE